MRRQLAAAIVMLLGLVIPVKAEEPIDSHRYVRAHFLDAQLFTSHKVKRIRDNYRRHAQHHRAGKRTHAYAARKHSSRVVASGRPSGCPSAWCGCWLAQHLGLSDRNLWLARSWAHMGSAASPDTANVVVWSHHVGMLKGRRGDQILVLSGNDGRAVRERWRSTRGVIAWRYVGARYAELQ